jgi:hypothetical protein
MREMKEELLQFAWQHRVWRESEFKSTKGKKIRILKVGELNRNSGPDFFNAHIEVDGVLLVGNVEIHIRTSDWKKHGHESDSAYDRIILHAVYEHDVELDQNILNNVEVLELKDLLPEFLLGAHSELDLSQNKIPCSPHLKELDENIFLLWLERMMVERLEQKYAFTEELFKSFQLDLQQTFYCLLLRNFGFKVNSFPFELLSRQIPFKTLFVHQNSVLQLEALLLGTSGFLDETLDHPYLKQLQNEFEYLRNKYGIVPLKKEIFKFSRLRPANFPTLRLAQFAQLFHASPLLFSDPLSFTEFEKIAEPLRKVKDQGFWKDHFSFTESKGKDSAGLGEDSVQNLMINTFANFHFFYSKKFGKEPAADIALSLLEKCSAETNSIVKSYSSKKEQITSGAQSQALIHLQTHYCSSKKCLSCGIGVTVLKKAPATKAQNL